MKDLTEEIWYRADNQLTVTVDEITYSQICKIIAYRVGGQMTPNGRRPMSMQDISKGTVL